MTLYDVDTLIVCPTLAWLGAPYDSPRARAMLLAIGLQESSFRSRVQSGGGPAVGFWQFEPATILDFGTNGKLRSYVVRLGMRPVSETALAHGADQLACILARDLLWRRVRMPLPEVAEENEEFAWIQYLDAWRPGKPRRRAWVTNWAAACNLVLGD